jgi:pimeloyl-ACP methyl ester carboxylesterase
MLARTLRFLQMFELLLAAAVAWWLLDVWQWSAIAAILAGILVPLALHGWIIALDFAVAGWAGGSTPTAQRLGAAQALRTYLRELRDSVRVFQWMQPWLAGRPLSGEVDADQPSPCAVHMPSGAPLPVVLVHGYFCNRQLWRPLADWLSARGHSLLGLDLEPLFCSIDDYVPLLERAVRTAQSRTGAPRVALVCHSMGGLVARAYLQRHPDAPVARVITLGTPHRGTVHARFGKGVNVRQMRPDSDWLRALAGAESAANNARFTVVFSHHDNIVAPQHIQQLPGAQNIGLCGIGHVSLALDERVWRIIGDALEH